jgi:hypothetical protein
VTTQLMEIVLAVLAVAIAVNLLLTVRLLEVLRKPLQVSALTPPIGEPLFAVVGTALGGTSRPLYRAGKPAVWVFLSSRCPTCRQKLPLLEALLRQSRAAGFDLCLVSREPVARIEAFLSDTSLANTVLRVNKADYNTLNPTHYNPLYLFVDHRGVLEAGGEVGDENWQSFMAQMAELASGEEASLFHGPVHS